MLGRVSTKLEYHGEASADVERQILRAFARQAKRRVDAALAGLDENEDAGVQALADHVLETGRYGWDNL